MTDSNIARIMGTAVNEWNDVIKVPVGQVRSLIAQMTETAVARPDRVAINFAATLVVL